MNSNRICSHPVPTAFGSAEETAGDLMVQYSPNAQGYVIPAAVHPLTTSGRTVCRETSIKGQIRGVLTRQPLPPPSLPQKPTRQNP